MVTTSRQIEDAYGKIILFDLWSDTKKEWCFEPVLSFEGVEFDSVWDNDEYVFHFFCGLKKNKKEQIKELKKFCKENNIDYTYTQETLIEIFKTSKKLGWWKNFVKKAKLVENGS